MILITVGSTLFPFQRMTTLVEHVAHIRPNHELIIFQYGHTAPHFLDSHIVSYPFVSHKTLMGYMKRARVIISHGGPATIYQALSYGKVPWVLPREKRYGEHLNNHQVDFAHFMAIHNLVRIVTPETAIENLCVSDPQIQPVKKNNTKLIAYLTSLV